MSGPRAGGFRLCGSIMTPIDRISKAFARPGPSRAALPLAIVVVGVILAIVLPGHGSSTGNRAPAVGVHHGGTVARSDLAVAAAYLRLTSARLRGELRSGRTLAQLADAQGATSAAGLTDAISSARKATLNAAVAAGELSRADEQAALQTLDSRISAKVHRVGAYGLGGGAGGVPKLLIAAQYLGTPAAQLRRELRAGRTLGELASARSGRSAAGLIAVLLADRRARLQAALSTGALTSAREKRLLAALEARVSAEVARRQG
jgi:hypothetical protein